MCLLRTHTLLFFFIIFTSERVKGFAWCFHKVSHMRVLQGKLWETAFKLFQRNSLKAVFASFLKIVYRYSLISGTYPPRKHHAGAKKESACANRAIHGFKDGIQAERSVKYMAVWQRRDDSV